MHKQFFSFYVTKHIREHVARAVTAKAAKLLTTGKKQVLLNRLQQYYMYDQQQQDEDGGSINSPETSRENEVDLLQRVRELERKLAQCTTSAPRAPAPLPSPAAATGESLEEVLAGL